MCAVLGGCCFESSLLSHYCRHSSPRSWPAIPGTPGYRWSGVGGGREAGKRGSNTSLYSIPVCPVGRGRQRNSLSSSYSSSSSLFVSFSYLQLSAPCSSSVPASSLSVNCTVSFTFQFFMSFFFSFFCLIFSSLLVASPFPPHFSLCVILIMFVVSSED